VVNAAGGSKCYASARGQRARFAVGPFAQTACSVGNPVFGLGRSSLAPVRGSVLTAGDALRVTRWVGEASRIS
jgi:hypothetical protein